MQDSVPLHIATTIEDLETIAVAVEISKYQKSSRTLESAMKSLYSAMQREVTDQEKCYILCLRYLYLLDRVSAIGDENFVREMYGREKDKVLQKLKDLRRILVERYRIEIKNLPPPKSENKDLLEKTTVEDKRLFKGDYITCKQLYVAMANKSNLLLVDIRLQNQYLVSQIIYGNVINIPENVIKPGLSANALGLELTDDAKVIWNKRDEFDAMVLLDWNSSSTTFTSSKLAILKAAVVEWDCLRNYRQHPVILDGGFVEFVDSYPTYVTNAYISIARRNEDIDELLELDSIDYPKSNVSEMTLKEFTIEKIEESFSSEDNSDITVPIARGIIFSSDTTLNDSLEIKLAINDTPETVLLDDSSNNLDETRQRLLLEARDSKINLSFTPPAASSSLDSSLAEVPIVDLDIPPIVRRETKPLNFFVLNRGWCGLVNIRNTCYMNTILQCLKCVPIMCNVFVVNYDTLIKRRPPLITLEFGNAIKALWGGTEEEKCVFQPTAFYEAICRLDSLYSRGNHEDCMEFFLFLFNHLNEDCAFDITSRITLEREKAWYQHLQGRTSIWVDLFYHQFKCIKICPACKLKAETYEIDNTVMVSVEKPRGKMQHLKQMVEKSMEEHYILDFKCTKCEHLGVTESKTIVVEPEILVVVLKRYYQTETLETKKSNAYVDFDLRMKFGRYDYRLFSVAQHVGTMSQGHYFTHGYLDNRWVEFNDERVTVFSGDWAAIRKAACAFFYCKKKTT